MKGLGSTFFTPSVFSPAVTLAQAKLQTGVSVAMGLCEETDMEIVLLREEMMERLISR